MNQEKRYHPLLMLYDLWNLIKNTFFLFIFLFVIQANSEFWLFTYGRFTIILLFLLILLSIPIKWFTSKYKIGNNSLQLKRQLLITSSRTIPYPNIQLTRQKATIFHRIFNLTSLTLETSTAGDNSTVTFHVLTLKEIQEIEKQIRTKKKGDQTDDSYRKKLLDQPIEYVKAADDKPNYMVHFTPTTYDMLKATLASFSFIAVIPIVWSLISNLIQVFPIGEQLEDIFMNILNSWPWWIIFISLVLFILATIAAGSILTILKYGKYEIASDSENIYVTQGISERTTFTILKANVQAISVHQSLIKRILGLAEVKLICAGNTDNENLEMNRLYPFLSVKRAYTIMEEILPAYQVTPIMNRLSKKARWLQMVKPSWLWMIATGFLYYFRPDFLGFNIPWWVLSTIVFILVIASRLLQCFQTRYTLNKQFIQFKTGGFHTKLFLSKRNKIVELQFTHNVIQQKLGLASIVISNYAKPVLQTKITNLPFSWCKNLSRWYMLKEQSN